MYAPIISGCEWKMRLINRIIAPSIDYHHSLHRIRPKGLFDPREQHQDLPQFNKDYGLHYGPPTNYKLADRQIGSQTDRQTERQTDNWLPLSFSAVHFEHSHVDSRGKDSIRQQRITRYIVINWAEIPSTN